MISFHNLAALSQPIGLTTRVCAISPSVIGQKKACRCHQASRFPLFVCPVCLSDSRDCMHVAACARHLGLEALGLAWPIECLQRGHASRHARASALVCPVVHVSTSPSFMQTCTVVPGPASMQRRRLRRTARTCRSSSPCLHPCVRHSSSGPC